MPTVTLSALEELEVTIRATPANTGLDVGLMTGTDLQVYFQTELDPEVHSETDQPYLAPSCWIEPNGKDAITLEFRSGGQPHPHETWDIQGNVGEFLFSNKANPEGLNKEALAHLVKKRLMLLKARPES